MELFQIFILAIIQGLTEFLPISSSGHLILVPHLTGWDDQGLAFDVAVHVGTLAAVVWYFRKEVIQLLQDWGLSVARRETVGESRLAWGIIIGTIPAGLVGLSISNNIEEILRSPMVIAATTIGFGALLWYADSTAKQTRNESQLSWRDFIIIGCAQAIALIPGTSRSGITITAGLMLGMTREAAARFSFLLSIPVIFLAGGLKTIELVQTKTPVDWTALTLGAIFSAISAYICIALFLKWINQIGMRPFVWYRFALGIFLIGYFS